MWSGYFYVQNKSDFVAAPTEASAFFTRNQYTNEKPLKT